MYLHCVSDAKASELTFELWQITNDLLKCKSPYFGRMKYMVVSLVVMENSLVFIYWSKQFSVFLKSKQFPSLLKLKWRRKQIFIVVVFHVHNEYFTLGVLKSFLFLSCSISREPKWTFWSLSDYWWSNLWGRNCQQQKTCQE